MLRKLVERKRGVDVEANFRSLQTQGKTAIGCKKENQFEKEERNNTEGRFFRFLADARHCIFRQSAARWQQELMEHTNKLVLVDPTNIDVRNVKRHYGLLDQNISDVLNR